MPLPKLMNSYRPYKKGYFGVSDGHKLYYEMCGNPKGKPALFLHGGPGAGFSPKYKRFFDPKVYNILLFDQRGAGRSKPFASVYENTTWKLVQDTKAFLDFCGVDKVLLVGGSWGGTLAAVFAIAHTSRVWGIIWSGVFLGGKKNTEYAIGDGVRDHFPEIWEELFKHVPDSEKSSVLQYYYKQVISDDEETREKFCKLWAKFEMSLLRTKFNPQKVEQDLKEHSYKSLSVLELHYLSNNCFIPQDYIMDNAEKLSETPISLIQGRYDLLCRPRDAYELHKKLKSSTLNFTTGGHSTSEKETKEKIIEEVKRFSLM